MKWVVFFVLSFVILSGAVFLSAFIHYRRYKIGRVLTPFNVFFGGLFISVVICLLPVYSEMVENGFLSLPFAIHNTFQIFTVDADKNIIIENVKCPEEWLNEAYRIYLSVIFVIAPVLSFGFVLSFFKNLSSFFRYIVSFYKDAYVFSELNERSIALARDIKNNHKHVVIAFTDVFENNEETSYELVEQAREIGAICFKKDLLAINFKLHGKSAALNIFIIGTDEGENIEQSLKMTEKLTDRDKSSIYIFSNSVESELLLAQNNSPKLRIRRIDETRALITRLLYERGSVLFESAMERNGEDKLISAVVVGLGMHGTEMLKALSWYCQMDGYEIRINAFDKDVNAKDKLELLCPELLSDKLNKKKIKGESQYSIDIHPGCDTLTKSFTESITSIKDITYVFVALGSDELNIQTAVTLRMIFERMNINPVIQAVVYNTVEKNALNGVTNFRKKPYNIDFIGDIKTNYSERVIINSELESAALRRHLKWGSEEEFFKYEYNYRSSVASAMHAKVRRACRIPGSDKKVTELTDEEKLALEVLEHRRWATYLRSEGYIYSGKHDPKTRNDLAKMHHNLIPYDELTEEEKRKDLADDS